MELAQGAFELVLVSSLPCGITYREKEQVQPFVQKSHTSKIVNNGEVRENTQAHHMDIRKWAWYANGIGVFLIRFIFAIRSCSIFMFVMSAEATDEGTSPCFCSHAKYEER